MDSRVILAGQPVNALAAIDQGTAAAARANDVQHSNAFRGFMQQNGAGVLAGDQAALNGLAGFDPQAALGVQQSRLGMDATRQQMNFRDTAEGRAIETHVAQMGATKRAEMQSTIDAGMRRAVAAYTKGDLNGVNQVLVAAGEEPLQSLEQFPSIAALYAGAVEVLENYQSITEQPETALPASVTALQWRAEQAGLKPGSPEYAEFMIGGGRAKEGFEFQSPDGTVIRMGDAASGEEGGRIDPSSPDMMVASIDGILNDPALDSATGILSFTQAIPGSPMYRVGTRIKQLDGQAFLQAFEGLKGGGQITEIEGQKATQALGRLDSAQSPADYRAALTEMRSILSSGMSRPQGWVETQRRRAQDQDVFTVDQITNMSPADISALGSDALMRIPATELKGLTDEQWDALISLGGN